MAHPGFIVEFNNPNSYGKDLSKNLVELGLKCRQLAHKTAWWVGYDNSIRRLPKLQLALASAIQLKGSAIIVSRKTGKAWVLTRNKKNKPNIVDVK